MDFACVENFGNFVCFQGLNPVPARSWFRVDLLKFAISRRSLLSEMSSACDVVVQFQTSSALSTHCTLNKIAILSKDTPPTIPIAFLSLVGEPVSFICLRALRTLGSEAEWTPTLFLFPLLVMTDMFQNSCWTQKWCSAHSRLLMFHHLGWTG